VILRPGGFYTHSMRHAFKTMPVEALEAKPAK
jgi:hypothetical protein